jgi:hypothetical protein
VPCFAASNFVMAGVTPAGQVILSPGPALAVGRWARKRIATAPTGSGPVSGVKVMLLPLPTGRYANLVASSAVPA